MNKVGSRHQCGGSNNLEADHKSAKEDHEVEDPGIDRTQTIDL
jgi:hypothetical protein